MEIIKLLTNIKINMLRDSNINHITFLIRELILILTRFLRNMHRHIMILTNIMFHQSSTIILKEIKTLQPAINIKNKTKILYLFLFFNIVFLSSCSRDKYDNETLYNSVGFDQGSMPNQGSGQQKIAPDYFYRQAQGGMGGGYQGQGGGVMPNPGYPPQYQQQMPQQYYPPNYSSPPYQVYPNAGSRFYSNPYAIPPSPYYPQYDVDQYYVPPTYSYGMEQSGAPANRSNNTR
jgi:hypothetical protein